MLWLVLSSRPYGRACVTVRDTVINLQNKGTVWRTLNKENINQAFNSAEVELSDAFVIFNVSYFSREDRTGILIKSNTQVDAHVANNRSQSGLAKVLQSDRQHILRYLDDLLKRSQLLAEAFEKKEKCMTISTGTVSNVSWEMSVGDVVIDSQDNALLGSGTIGKVLRGGLGRKVSTGAQEAVALIKGVFSRSLP